MTNEITSSTDYCPYCKRRTKGLKDFEDKEYLCQRCGRISKLTTIETFGGAAASPEKLKNSYVKWFKKRIV